MKTAASLPFSCRVARQWSALSGHAPRHVEACAECRAFFAAGDALESALRRTAHAERIAAPAGFEQRLVNAVNRATRTAPPPARRTSPWIGFFSFAAVAACAALAVVWLRPSDDPVATDLDATTLATASAVIDALPFEALSELRPRAEALLQQDPLQSEANAVVSDARVAVRFLALNFLPAKAEPPRDRG